MSSLSVVLRERSGDRDITSSDLDAILTTALGDSGGGGVTASELREIVQAFAQTSHGFTPAHRAQIWVRLSGIEGAGDALQALEGLKAESAGADRLAETQARVELLAGAVEQAMVDLGSAEVWLFDGAALAEGRLVPVAGADPAAVESARAALAAAQGRLVLRRSQLAKALPKDHGEREMVLASFDYSARWTWRRLSNELPFAATAGLSPPLRAMLEAPLPALATEAPEGGSKSFAGLRLRKAVAWTFDDSNGRLMLPAGSAIERFPDAGTLAIESEGVALPSGAVLVGRGRIASGKLELQNGASLTRDGVRVVAEGNEANVSFASGVLAGGPNLRVDLPLLDAIPERDAKAGDGTSRVAYSTRRLVFALTDSTLPDGTKLVQGRGSVDVVLRGGEPIGVLAGTTRFDAGATIVRYARDDRAIAVQGHGGTAGELRQGGVALKDSKVVGFEAYSSATIDGLTLKTGTAALTSYELVPPSVYQLGAGVEIEGVPADREVTLRGEMLTLKLGDREVLVRSGGVVVRGGKIAAIEAGAVVVIGGAEIRSTRGPVTLLEGPPSTWPSGNAVYVTDHALGARGSGIHIAAADAERLLRAMPRGTRVDLELTLGEPNGSVEIRSGRDRLLPAHLDVSVQGAVSIASGSWLYDSTTRTAVQSAARAGRAGLFLRVRQDGRTYEIDPRPMVPGADGKLVGRFREVPELAHPGRFGGPLLTQTRAVLDGSRTLGRGAKGELVRQVQHVLGYYLGEPSGADGVFGAQTEGALKRFQRLNLLEPTGVVDAATLRALDVAAPADGDASPRRQKTMVMVALNGDVPDELRRFRELAAERGARPVIIGHPDGDIQDLDVLGDFFARAERGEIDLDWLVVSGHSTGSSTWGSYGSLSYTKLKEYAETYPRAAAQIEKLTLLNCYNVTIARANSYWPDMFPNVTGLAGFMYSAPGKKAQTSDEHLLHSGRLMARIGKGEVPNQSTARSIGSQYAADNHIKWQNASMWIRYREGDGSVDQGEFAMTPSARNELRRHGAGDELEVAAFAQAQIFERYLKAQAEGFERPPAEHHRGPLREYLNAVDTVLGTWEQRLARLERYEQRRRDNPNFEIPEEYLNAYGWDGEVQRLRDLRAQILYLIYFDDMRKLFDQKYGPTIAAFNELLAQQGVAERFPSGAELRGMNRKETLAMLERMTQVVNELPGEVRTAAIDAPGWRMMVGIDPAVTQPSSPWDFVHRAEAFLGTLDRHYIAPEWL